MLLAEEVGWDTGNNCAPRYPLSVFGDAGWFSGLITSP